MQNEKRMKKVLRVDRQDESSLSAFVERPVPTEKEVASFERVIQKEARQNEIDDNLSEIYRDKKGGLVDVKKLKVKRRQFFLIRWFRNLLILGLIGLAAYFAYIYFFSASNDVSALELKITGPEKIIAAEEFSYLLEYRNPTKFTLSQVHLEMQYPTGFIFKTANVPPQSGNYGWNLPDLAPGESATITITGQLINQPDTVNVVIARLSYVPLGLSTQFKKEANSSTIVSGPGFRVDLEAAQTAFLAQENDLNLIFSDVKNNYLGDFGISFSLPEEANAWAASTSPEASGANLETKKIVVTKTGGAAWQVSGLSPEIGRQTVPLKYKINTKSSSTEIVVRLEKKTETGESYVFWEKIIRPELVKSDLNLTLFLNGSKNDGALNFGQALNYTLSYSNQGSNTYKEVVVMAVITGDFLNWSTLKNDKGGELRNKNTLIWTKNEVPELAEIKPGQEGEISFTINLKPFREGDLGQNLSVVGYGQYSVNNQAVTGDNNKSNTITSKINSDLYLNEQIRYFNEDNAPVGSGPLPPKVDEKTSFRVYWTVKNNLHELTETRVIFNLPSYVKWDEKNTMSVGSLYYDATSHQVIWEIGRLPVSVYRADAEFGISITPSEADRNKILILSPGSTVSATDSETKDVIIKRTDPKTTKLEDDDIAGMSNSGRVQ